MTELTYDLHIHSCLSPCGDNEAYPSVIAGYAALKGLRAAALTDHNTARNCPAFLRCAEAYGIIGIPGMEINTMEEVHAVCLFRTLEAALDFDRFVYGKLQKVKNDPKIFGDQLLMDEEDRVTGTEEYLLINACDISFDCLYGLVRSYDGVMIPAHIDKQANSLLGNLGLIPENSEFRTVELKDLTELHRLRREHPYLQNCQIISSSDAHTPEKIREASLVLPVEEESVNGVIDALLRGPADLFG